MLFELSLRPTLKEAGLEALSDKGGTPLPALPPDEAKLALHPGQPVPRWGAEAEAWAAGARAQVEAGAAAAGNEIVLRPLGHFVIRCGARPPPGALGRWGLGCRSRPRAIQRTVQGSA